MTSNGWRTFLSFYNLYGLMELTIVTEHFAITDFFGEFWRAVRKLAFDLHEFAP